LALGFLMFGQIWKTRWMRRHLVGERLARHCLGKPVNNERRLTVSRPPLLIGIASGFGALVLSVPATWSLTKGIRALLNGQGDIMNLLYGAVAAGATVWLIGQCGKHLRSARQPC